MDERLPHDNKTSVMEKSTAKFIYNFIFWTSIAYIFISAIYHWLWWGHL